MAEYVYGFRFVLEEGEVFFCFPKIGEIISALPQDELERMDGAAIYDHAHDAVVAALQARVTARESLPDVDDYRRARADGFVRLSPTEAMKLELYKLYADNCQSVADFARQFGKAETLVRRLLDLRHRSKVTEIEAAVRFFGKQFLHRWDVEPIPHGLLKCPRATAAA